MLIEVDFNSDEALYIQLQNQIILGIAMDLIKEGDALPSVRQMADLVGHQYAYGEQGVYNTEAGRIYPAGP